MLSWSLTFFGLAIVAAVFGFGGIAASLVGVAKILFFVFLVLLIVSLLVGRRATTGAMLAFLLALTAGSCGDSAEAGQLRDSSREVIEDAKVWTEATWNDFVRGSEQRLEAAKSDARRLRERLAAQGEEASAEVAARLDELDARLEAVAADAGRMAEKGRESGRELAAGLGRAIDEIEASIVEAKQSLDG
jgi:uncharacterized membrane protein YtjA (UPF0391 family)